MNTSTDLKFKKHLLDFVVHFSENTKKENWVSHYDAESDSFVLRTPKLSQDAKKKYINDELAFYFTKDGKIEGLFIEYFTSNFILHNKNFKKRRWGYN